MEYVKVKMSFKEKILLLFFGILPKRLLRKKVEETETKKEPEKQKVEKENITDKKDSEQRTEKQEDSFEGQSESPVPFFDLDKKTATSSNLDDN